MDKLIERLLDAISDIVDDESMPYRDKVRKIKAEATESDRWDVSLEEFLSWFDEAE